VIPPSLQTGAGLDELMSRASDALVRTEYFECERLCLRAMNRARAAADFERMARICMPLQESRRWIRQTALDAGFQAIVTAPARIELPLGPGCYLLAPPLVGIEAAAFRAHASGRRVAAFVLAREPTTRAGKWPIVGVGGGDPLPVVVRLQTVPPPADLPDVGWFSTVQEALGDAAIQRVRPEWPADHRVDDFLEFLEAVPDHEKLLQALEAASREACTAGVNPLPRRRGKDDPLSF